ncbi:unnamed protein product [Calypogeia fissa]
MVSYDNGGKGGGDNRQGGDSVVGNTGKGRLWEGEGQYWGNSGPRVSLVRGGGGNGGQKCGDNRATMGKDEQWWERWGDNRATMDRDKQWWEREGLTVDNNGQGVDDSGKKRSNCWMRNNGHVIGTLCGVSERAGVALQEGRAKLVLLGGNMWAAGKNCRWARMLLGRTVGRDAETTEQMEKLINRLRSDFGKQFIITLAPVASDLMPAALGLSFINYTQLFEDERRNISWFNVQFYSGFGSLASTPDFQAIVNNSFPADVIVGGMLANPSDGGGFVDIGTLNMTVQSLVKQFPNFGGVAAFEYFKALPGGTPRPAEWGTYFGKVMGGN